MNEERHYTRGGQLPVGSIRYTDAEIRAMLASPAGRDPGHPDHAASRRLMRGLGGRPDLDFVRTVAAGRPVSARRWAGGRHGGGPVHVDAYTRDGPRGPISVVSHARSAPRRG